jgi:hypothetical protein
MPISAIVTELTEGDGREPSKRDVETEITVHHIHLPKLADAGVIEYNQSTQKAVYTASPQIDSLLEDMLVTVSTGERDPSPQE